MKLMHVEAGMHLYGGALQVVFLMRGLAARGEQGVLVCPLGSAVGQAVRDLGLPVREIPMGGDADVGLIVRLRRLICEERPDVLHLHSRRGADVWGTLAGRLAGLPVVLSRRVDNPEASWWAAIKYRIPHRVVAISQGIRQVLLAEGVAPQRVLCVPSAVDTERYRPEPADMAWFRAEFGLADDELTLGMVAQFIERKGHRTLLDALPAVLEKHPRVRVLMLGQGPIAESIRQRVQADAQLAGRVLLPGFRSDLHRVLPCLDLLVHPAFMEGLGVSLLQAAACGLPVVAGRAGGIPEIVQPGLNGELITPGDAPALAGHINRLLGSAALRQAYGLAGRSWVEQHFSIAAMVQGNWNVYRSLLDSAAKR